MNFLATQRFWLTSADRLVGAEPRDGAANSMLRSAVRALFGIPTIRGYQLRTASSTSIVDGIARNLLVDPGTALPREYQR